MNRIGLLLALSLATPALAHDFWIEPESFSPESGTVVPVTLRVGERLDGEPLPRNGAKIERFVARRERGEAPVAGLDGSSPAGILRAEDPGGVVLVYRGLRSAIELDADRFDAYLEAEGLDTVRAERRRRGSPAVPGREVYSRCAKSLVAVAGRGGTWFTHPVGLALEIVPEADPYALGAGDALGVKVLFHASPLPGALVMALDRTGAHAPQRVRSDASGRAVVALPRAGMWLVKAVHMVPAPEGIDADWESFWASLTFEVGPGPAPRR